MKPWTYQQTAFEPAYNHILLNQWTGFIYLITNNETDRAYIGKKNFHCFRKHRAKQESDWSFYYGSCEPLRQDVIKFGDSFFTRQILSLHKTPSELSYHEIKAMFAHDVLFSKNKHGQKKFYNDVIWGSKFSTGDFS